MLETKLDIISKMHTLQAQSMSSLHRLSDSLIAIEELTNRLHTSQVRQAVEAVLPMHTQVLRMHQSTVQLGMPGQAQTISQCPIQALQLRPRSIGT